MSHNHYDKIHIVRVILGPLPHDLGSILHPQKNALLNQINLCAVFQMVPCSHVSDPLCVPFTSHLS